MKWKSIKNKVIKNTARFTHANDQIHMAKSSGRQYLVFFLNGHGATAAVRMARKINIDGGKPRTVTIGEPFEHATLDDAKAACEAHKRALR